MKIILLFFQAILFVQFGFAQQIENYLTDYYINDVYVNEKNIWISTQGGLMRFDENSENKVIFQADNSPLKGSEVKKVVEGKDGSIWVASAGAGLFRYKPDCTWERYTQLNDSTYFGYIFDIEVSSTGKLWFFASYQKNCSSCLGLFTYDGKKFSRHDKRILSLLGIECEFKTGNILLDKSGNYWGIKEEIIFSYNGVELLDIFKDFTLPLNDFGNLSGLAISPDNKPIVTQNEQRWGGGIEKHFKYENGSWVEIPELKLLFDYTISKVHHFADQQGVLEMKPHYRSQNEAPLYFNYENGLLSKNEKLQQHDPSNIAVNTKSKLTYIDYTGKWWMNFWSLFVETDTGWHAYDTEITPIKRNRFEAMVVDCENNIWFGYSRGALRFDGKNWIFFNAIDMGFSEGERPNISDLFLDKNTCEIIFSFYGGENHVYGLGKYDGENFTIIENRFEFTNVVVDFNGNIWATTLSGVAKYASGRWEFFNESNSILSNSTTNLVVDKKGNIWVGAKGLYKYDGTDWIYFPTPSDGYAFKISIDSEDNIYSQINNDLFIFEGNNWLEIPMPDSTRAMYSFLKDGEKNLWVATTTGLWKMDSFNNWTIIDVFNSNLPSSHISEIEFDQDQNLWIRTINGISKMSFDNLPKPDPKQFKFTVYPNPSNGKLFVNFFEKENLPKSNLKVFNSAGQLIKKLTPIDNFCLELPQGFYIFEWSNNIVRSVEKVVVIK